MNSLLLWGDIYPVWEENKTCIEIDWIFNVLRLAQEFLTNIWRRHHGRWRAAKFRPILGP
jgi:hypothetical protein